MDKTWIKKAAGILFTDGSHMLLLKRAGQTGGEKHIGTWALPGGKAKDGETEINAAVREAKEETGLSSIPGFRFDSLSNKNSQQKFTTFLYRVPKKFDVTLSKEHSDWAWVPFDDLRGKELHPKFREQLPRYLTAIRRKIVKFDEWSKVTDLILTLE